MLSERRAELRLFRFSTPVHSGNPGLVFGTEKYELLARSRLLVNVHRDDSEPGYFEWVRMVEAMANGCTVITEPCTGFEPLLPGVHFVEASDLASAVREMLDDPGRAEGIGEAGRHAVLDEIPLSSSLAPLLDRVAACDLRGKSARPRRRSRRPSVTVHDSPILSSFRPAARARERVFRALVAEQRASPRDRVGPRARALRRSRPHLGAHHPGL